MNPKRAFLSIRWPPRSAVVLLLVALCAKTRADNPVQSAATAPSPQAASQPVREGSSPAQPPTSQPTLDAPATLTGNWFGLRKTLDDDGITFDISLTLDGSKTLRGGIDTAGSAWRNLFEATITLDTKPLLNLEGGRIFVDFQNAAGQNATLHEVGDAQKFDNIDADGRTQIAQLWYQQTLFDEKLRFKIGKVDANSEFDKSDNTGEFLHSSSTFSPTIFVLPTYPDGATAFNVFVRPWAGFYGGAGVYDGSLARGVLTGSQGPRTFFRDPHDLFFIVEVGRRWGTESGQLPGRLGLGGWYDTNRFARFNAGRDSGAGGSYFLLDQTVWRPADASDDKDARGLGLFLMGGEADPAVSLFQWHFGGGFAWTGPVPNRRRDVLGMGFNAVRFSSEAHLRHDSEVAIELFYRLQLTPWASIKPDLQYITTPGGMHRDAWVATMRFVFAF